MLSKIRKERREKDEEREALKEPDTLLGKLFEPKEKKEKRQAIKDRIEAEKRKFREQARKIVEEEEDKKKKQRVIKWKWGEDPFKLRGESIQYDTPCQAHTYFMDIVGYSKKTESSLPNVALVSYCFVSFTFRGLGLILKAVDVTL